MIAFLILTLARTNGVNDSESYFTITVRSAVHVAVAYPLFTIGAHLAMTGLPQRIPLFFRALVGCWLMAPLLAVVAPVATWMFGVLPLHVYEGTERADLIEGIRLHYWRIVIGFATLGPGLWLFLNFEWWRFKLGADMPLRTPESPAKQPSPFLQGAAGVVAGPTFVRRLSAEKRGALWALTAEQHYLRVYTNKGDDLILMRLSDALGELEQADGLQIHRSHWVARTGVERLEEEDKRLFVILKNGVRLPVSRPNNAAAKLMFAELPEQAEETSDSVVSAEPSKTA